MNDELEFEDDGLPLSRTENEKWLVEAEKTPKGVVIHPEDINKDDLIAVYNLKKNPEELTALMGQTVKVLAVQLPYIVASVYSTKELLTLDVRFLTFMRVSKEFAEAQVNKIEPRKRGPQE